MSQSKDPRLAAPSGMLLTHWPHTQAFGVRPQPRRTRPRVPAVGRVRGALEVPGRKGG